MELTGRVTANAVVRTTNTGKEVVSFNVAYNERYRSAEGEIKTITDYYQCSFWLGTGVAKALTKGTLVTLSGRPGANAWIREGQPVASLQFNARKIHIHATAKQETGNVVAMNTPAPAATTGTGDDLPF